MVIEGEILVSAVEEKSYKNTATQGKSQQAHDVCAMLAQHQCNVMTLYRR